MKTFIVSLLLAFLTVTNCYATLTQVSSAYTLPTTIYANEANNFYYNVKIENTSANQIIYENMCVAVETTSGSFIQDIKCYGITTLAANTVYSIGVGSATLSASPGTYRIRTSVFTQNNWYLLSTKNGASNPQNFNVISRPSTYTYSWTNLTWSSCNTTCGTGSQTRAPTCKRNDGLTVADSYCGTKPAVTQSCTDNSGCPAVTYNWYQSGFGPCNASCGDGIKTQTVSCKSSNGSTVADSYCAGAKPATTQACIDTSACSAVTYNWYQSGFGACSATCGNGYKYQTVYCKDSTGAAAADSSCSGAKPSTSQACSDTSGCVAQNMPEFLNSGIITPTTGTSGELFKFEVKARDLDGDNISAKVEITNPDKTVNTYVMSYVAGSGGSKDGATFTYSIKLSLKGIYSYRFNITSAGDSLFSEYVSGPKVSDPVVTIPEGKAKQYMEWLKTKSYDLGAYEGCIEEESRPGSCANFLTFKKGTIVYDDSSRKLYWNNRATAYNGEWIQAVYPRQHGAYTPYTLQFVWSPFLTTDRNIVYDVQIATSPNFNSGEIFFDTSWIGASIGSESHYRMDAFTASHFFQGKFKQKVYARIVAKEFANGKTIMYSNQLQFTMWPAAGESFSLFDTAYADGAFGGAAVRRSGEDGLKMFEYVFSGYMLYKSGQEAIELTSLYYKYWRLNKAQWGLSTVLRINPYEMKVFFSGFKLTIKGAGLLVGVGLIACDVAYDNACTNIILDTVDKYILQSTGMSLGYEGLSFWDNLWFAFMPTAYASDESVRQKANFEIYLAQFIKDASKLSNDQLRSMSLFLNYQASVMFTNGRLTPNYLTNITIDKSQLATRSKSTNQLIRAVANNLLWHLTDNKPTGFSPITKGTSKAVVESSMVDLGIRDYPAATQLSVVQTSGPKVALASNNTFVAPPVGTGGEKLGFHVSVIYDGVMVTEDVTVDVASSNITGLPAGVYKAKAPNGNIVGVTSDQSIIKLELVDPVTLVDARNVPDDMYYFLDVNIKVASPGQSAILNMHFDKPLPIGFQFLKYNSRLGWYVYPQVTLGADRKTANIVLTDGGTGDDDGVANGVIVDPGGFGLVTDGTPTSDGYKVENPASTTEGGKGGGGCFIATAAYGSYLHPLVKVLRDFRDQILLQNAPGRWFVKQYYHYSPPLADWLAQHEVAKAIVRVLLIPLIAFAFIMLTIGPIGLVLFLGSLLLYKFRSRLPQLVHF